MSERENIFIRTTRPVREMAELLADFYDLEPFSDDGGATDNDIGLRGRAQTVDGWLGFRIHPNQHARPDPKPDELRAIDTYQVQVDVWYSRHDPVVQQREALVIFDRLVWERPSLAILLCHEVTFLVAAHLPGVGVHMFTPRTTMNAPDAELWRPWLVSPSWTSDMLDEWDPAVVRRACEVLSDWYNRRMPVASMWVMPNEFARYSISPCDEWLLFTAGRSPSGGYLVCEDTVYPCIFTVQALDDALRSARALRRDQRPWWRRLGMRRRS